MDHSTEQALRAILRGLYDSGAVGEDQMRSVMRALKDAASAATEQYQAGTAKELVALCKGIRADTAISAD